MKTAKNIISTFDIIKPELSGQDDRSGDILSVEAKYGHWVIKTNVPDIHVRSAISIGVLWKKKRYGKVLEMLTDGRYIVQCKHKPRVGVFDSKFNVLFDKYQEQNLGMFSYLNNLGLEPPKKENTFTHFEG